MTEFDPWADWDATQEEASKKVSSTPPPAANYNVSLYEAKVEDFTSNKNSAYYGKGLKSLAVTLKIVDGDFKDRQIWDRVSLFPKFLPSEKNPSGAINRNFFSFFQRSLGMSAEQFKALAQKIHAGQDISADLRPFLGTVFSIKSKVEQQEGYDAQAKVAFFNDRVTATPSASTADAWAAASESSTPATQAAAADPWGTPKEDPALAAAAASSNGF